VSDIPDDLVNYVKADADYFGLVGLKKACENNTLQKKNEAIRKENEAKQMKKYKVVSLDDFDRNSTHYGDEGWQIENIIPDLVVDNRIQRIAICVLSAEEDESD
jgi:hypothetical protein